MSRLSFHGALPPVTGKLRVVPYYRLAGVIVNQYAYLKPAPPLPPEYPGLPAYLASQARAASSVANSVCCQSGGFPCS